MTFWTTSKRACSTWYACRTDNLIIEAISSCAEQTLLSQKSKLYLMFPEDLGGHSQSLWALREFQSLHGVNDACRGAGFLCQLGHAEFRRPVGVLTNIASLFDKLYRGWPLLSRSDRDLKCRGPPPNHCPCVPPHNNLRGVDASDHFISASSSTLGERFLSWILGTFLTDGPSSSLRDGGTSNSTLRSTSSFSSWSPLLAVALASGSCSLRMFYDSWKHCTFTVSKTAEVLSSEGIASYFRSSAPSCLASTTWSPLSSVWLTHSSSSSISHPTVSVPIVPATTTAKYLAVHGLAHPELRKRP